MSSVKLEMKLEHSWNFTDKEKAEYSEINLNCIYISSSHITVSKQSSLSITDFRLSAQHLDNGLNGPVFEFR